MAKSKQVVFTDKAVKAIGIAVLCIPYGLPPIASVTSSREMPCRAPNS